MNEASGSVCPAVRPTAADVRRAVQTNVNVAAIGAETDDDTVLRCVCIVSLINFGMIHFSPS